jgi:nucleolar protein 14
MPPSQLKRLKASLREQGIVGPQKSKKQKKQDAQSGANKDKRVNRTTALSGIREQFNPFEVKTSARGPKFDVTNSKNVGGATGTKSIKARPGVSRGLAEENRRKTLLVEMQRRNKVGGILDKRFGENDPSMAPEDKMLERFTQEIQRRHKNSSAFDLEDDDFSGELTHMGQSLSLNGPAIADDFIEDDLVLSDAEDHPEDEERRLKRRRGSDSEGSEDEESPNLPERKKTKQEVMKEVIAKSKFHKYERQAAKDDDEDLREELDKDMAEIHALLRGVSKPAVPKPAGISGMNPERAALLNGTDRVQFEKEYDLRLRQLAQDKKSKPTERLKTEEEKLAEQSRKLQDLEKARLRRMQGEADYEDNEVAAEEPGPFDEPDEEDEEYDEFGLGSGIKTKSSRPQQEELGVEDEDDFILDDDLVASGSDVELSDEDGSSDGEGEEEEDEGGDDGFLDGLLTTEEAKRPEFLTGANAPIPDLELSTQNGINGDLAYTFPCPQSHQELLDITEPIAVQDLPTVVRRIRALYHPQLKSENKRKLGKFTVALVDHISYLANQTPLPPFEIIESLTRHVHSLSKTFPVETGNAFRHHLEELHQSRPLAPTAGDLVLLTAIGTIFPTSDHFHQVVTPAILCMARFLGQKIPQRLSDYAMGTYLATLCISYQSFSKRFVPEISSFLMNTLCALAPSRLGKIPGSFPYHEPKISQRIHDAAGQNVRKLRLQDTINEETSAEDEDELKSALIQTCTKLIEVTADTWTGKSAFPEIFDSALKVLEHLRGKNCRGKLPQPVQVCTSLFPAAYKISHRPSIFPFLINQHGCQITIQSYGDCCCAEDVLILNLCIGLAMSRCLRNPDFLLRDAIIACTHLIHNHMDCYTSVFRSN